MGRAVYNLAIPNVLLNTENRRFRRGWLGAASVAARTRFHSVHGLRAVGRVSFLILGLALAAVAADWSIPEQELARKIVAVTGPGAVTLTMENRSSLGRRDSEVIQNGLRSALQGFGVGPLNAEPATCAVKISLSESSTSYVWVAEIRRGAGDAAVVMVSAPRAEGSIVAHDSVPLSLRKIPLWAQADPILDVAVLEENTVPTRLAVLSPENVSLYRAQAGRWEREQTLGIVHARPWPRDLRGRIVAPKDHLLDVHLPGVTCRSGGIPLALNCHESDDPWPLAPQMRASFAGSRNFFTGALTPGVGQFTTVPKFFSAALAAREQSTLWLFAATDGQTHVIDGASDRIAAFDWGSDIASVKTQCGAGWQVLATSRGEKTPDSIRAYEMPDRDPIAVSEAVDFPGTITALWTESNGDTAIAVTRNRETGGYEASRLAVACSQ